MTRLNLRSENWGLSLVGSTWLLPIDWLIESWPWLSFWVALTVLLVTEVGIVSQVCLLSFKPVLLTGQFLVFDLTLSNVNNKMDVVTYLLWYRRQPSGLHIDNVSTVCIYHHKRSLAVFLSRCYYTNWTHGSLVPFWIDVSSFLCSQRSLLFFHRVCCH